MAAAVAGAFLYHLYAKISVIEHLVTQESGQVISLSSLLDMATKEEEDKDEEVPVGFSTNPGKLRRKNVRPVL